MDNLMNLVNSVNSLSHAREILNEVKTMLANNLAAKIGGGDITIDDHAAIVDTMFELLGE
jgi:hypothetical protein